MSNEKLNIRNGSLFPWHFQLFAVVLVIGSIVLFLTNILLALILLSIGIVILTGYSGVLINKPEKMYKEYNSFLFIKTGKNINFEAVERLFVNENSISQKTYTAHTLNSSTFKNAIYDGYIKFGDGTKVHLMSKKDKILLMTKLKEIADFLGVAVYDNTVSDR